VEVVRLTVEAVAQDRAKSSRVGPSENGLGGQRQVSEGVRLGAEQGGANVENGPALTAEVVLGVSPSKMPSDPSRQSYTRGQ
jgi:hypothetical protein